jgi:ribonucleoside-diphosphate reductase alpha chain
VFRNNCKLSQPINTELTNESNYATGLKWGERRRIPNTRKSTTHKFSIAGLKGYITAGDYEDGTPAEVFLRVSKQGSFVNGVLEALATAVSVGLQHGVPLSLYVDKFRDQKFEPAGFTGNEDIRIAKSLPDYVFRWLENHYAEQKQEQEMGDAEIIQLTQTTIQEQRIEVVDLSAAHGPPCDSCGNLTRRSGSCYVCTNCGETTGCS